MHTHNNPWANTKLKKNGRPHAFHTDMQTTLQYLSCKMKRSYIRENEKQCFDVASKDFTGQCKSIACGRPKEQKCT